MKYIRCTRWIVLYCSLAIVLFSCQNSRLQKSDGKVKVSTSIEPLAGLVRMIADSTAYVQSLLPEGYSAENYELTTLDIKRVAVSDIYFAIGDLGFEISRLKKLETTNPNVKFVLLGENFCHNQGDHYADPHIWTSVRGLESIAQGIEKNLSNIDTTNSKFYKQRLRIITDRLDSMSTSIHQRLKDAKVKGFVIYHPSLSDYAKEFSITQLAIEHQGKEPNPKQLSQLIDSAKRLAVKVVFVQKEFNTRLSKTIAKEIGAKIYEINPLGKSPIKEIEHITSCLEGKV